MPLIQGKSKKSFSKNIKAEMKSGKPQDQSLAIAYSVKRKNSRKKMAEGGKPSLLDQASDAVNRAISKSGNYAGSADTAKTRIKNLTPEEQSDAMFEQRQKNGRPASFADGGVVNESAKSERRPMPDERDKDTKLIIHNSDKKIQINDGVLDQPTVKQAQKPSRVPLKHPKMVPSSVFSTRLRDEEDNLQSSASVNDGSQEQPPKQDDEEDAISERPDIPSLHMKKMANGGVVSLEEAAKTNEPAVPARKPDDKRLPQDEYTADHFAKGGMADSYSDQPREEAEEEHHASIAAAIMAKKARQSQLISDSDIDEQINLYEGGQVEGSDESQADIMSNGAEHPNAYYGHNEAILKENYDSDMDGVDQPSDSNEHGDSREEASENDQSLVSRIRSRMAVKRSFR